MFIPHAIPIPTVSFDNFLHQAASDIINVLTQPPPLLPTTYQIGNKIRNGLLQLATLLKSNQITNDKLHYLQNQLDFIHSKTPLTPKALTPKHNSNLDNDMKLLQQTFRKLAQNLSKLQQFK